MPVPDQEEPMTHWRQQPDIPPSKLRHGGGKLMNRECANCRPPCTAGEVLHRRGHCCRCDCQEFEAKSSKMIIAELGHSVKRSTRTGAEW